MQLQKRDTPSPLLKPDPKPVDGSTTAPTTATATEAPAAAPAAPVVPIKPALRWDAKRFARAGQLWNEWQMQVPDAVDYADIIAGARHIFKALAPMLNVGDEIALKNDSQTYRARLAVVGCDPVGCAVQVRQLEYLELEPAARTDAENEIFEVVWAGLTDKFTVRRKAD